MSKYLNQIKLPDGQEIQVKHPYTFTFTRQYYPSNDLTAIPIQQRTDTFNFLDVGSYSLLLQDALTPWIKLIVEKLQREGCFLGSFASSSDRLIYFLPEGGNPYFLNISAEELILTDPLSGVSPLPSRPGIFGKATIGEPDLKCAFSLPKLQKNEDGYVSAKSIFEKFYSLKYVHPTIFDFQDGACVCSYRNAFAFCTALKSVEIHNFDKTTDFAYFLANSAVSYCRLSQPTPNHISNDAPTSMDYMFAYADELEIIGFSGLTFSSVETTNAAFAGCKNLNSIFSLKNLSVSVSFADSPKLTRYCLREILIGVADLSNASAGATITLHPEAYARLTEDDIAIATAKNWSIVSA